MASQSKIVVDIKSEQDIYLARSVGQKLCRNLGFGIFNMTKLVTVISELARNIVQYAKSGQIEITSFQASNTNKHKGIEVIACDNGPGIANLDIILHGKYRSTTGLGKGLYAARKMTDEFEIQTNQKGTRVRVKKFVV